MEESLDYKEKELSLEEELEGFDKTFAFYFAEFPDNLIEEWSKTENNEEKYVIVCRLPQDGRILLF